MAKVDKIKVKSKVETHPDMIRRYELWLDRLKTLGMRHPNNPFRDLAPTHPLTQLEIKRLETELAYSKGKMTQQEYWNRIEKLEKKIDRLTKLLKSVKMPKKNVDVSMIFPNGKLWGALRKSWKGFKIAKASGDKEAMREWHDAIVEIQDEMRKRGMI